MNKPLGSSYVLHDLIGRGAMGEVWRATSRESDDPLAVKILRSELTTDPAIVSRFVLERTILLGLRHPHLVRIRDLVVEGETLAFVMDLVDGPNLRQMMAPPGGPLAPATACELMSQVAEGLSAVHAAGVVHRDLKPENILVDTRDPRSLRALVSDFGIAKITHGPSLTRLTSVVGTPEYMAPELAEGRHVAFSADLYSCGIVLYEALAGRTPFGGGHPVAVLRRHLEEAPSRPPGMPDELWALLETLLAKDPGARGPSASWLAGELAAAAPGLQGVAPFPDGDADPRQAATHHRISSQTPDNKALVPPLSKPTPPGPDKGSRLGPFLASRTARLSLFLLPILLIAGGLVAWLRPFSAAGPASGSGVNFAFAPSVYPNGVVVTRTWRVSGSSHTLTADLAIANSASVSVTATVDEVIPKSLANSTDAITFHPAPDALVKRDPVVRYVLTDLAPNARRSISYEMAVSPKAGTPSGLQALVQDQAVAQAAYTATSGAAATLVTLATLTVQPASVALAAGRGATFQVSGTMSDGSAASPQVLAGVAWSSSAPRVATVSQGAVTAVKAGSATITAQAGGLTASVAVTVTPINAAAPQEPPRAPAPPPSSPTPAPPPSTPASAPPPTPSPSPVACTNGFDAEPATPFTAMGDGTAVSWPAPGDGKVYIVAGGGLLYEGSPAELGAMISSGEVTPVQNYPASLGNFSKTPRSGTFIKEHGDPRFYEVVGGTAFYESSLDELRNFFGVSGPVVVPSGTIRGMLAVTPLDGSMLREHSSPQVFQILQGKPQPIDHACNPSVVRIVPDGSIKGRYG